MKDDVKLPEIFDRSQHARSALVSPQRVVAFHEKEQPGPDASGARP